jgi:hypothetical protein
MRGILLALGMLLAGCQSAVITPKQTASGQPIVLGRAFDIQSQAQGQLRRINVYTPPGYSDGSTSYPVLYVIDGGVEQDFVNIAGLSQHATISASFREMIVVGVETIDRRRELTAPAMMDASLRQEYPTHGESGKFRAFLANEVKPWVEQRYRTAGPTAVMGESLAGLFVAETFLRQPELFDGYVSIDPSLWWDNRALSAEAPGLLGKQPAGKRSLYLAIANGAPLMRLGQAQFAAAVESAGREGLTFVYRQMLDEAHSTIYHRAALDALRVVFAYPAESAE